MRTYLLVVLLLLVVPSGVAEWQVKGTREPDTLRDVTDGWNFLEPDTMPVGWGSPRKVYFNGIQGTEIGYVVSFGVAVNPNVGAAKTGFMSYPQRAWAMLGVWKDCNRDGYVGLGETGAIEYRSLLLLDPSVCPRGQVPYPLPDSLILHNDGKWVHEFLPLGWEHRSPGGTIRDSDPFSLNDAGARVWADDGLPGEPPATTSCYLFAPSGSFRSSGGLIDVIDCYAGGWVNDAVKNAATHLGAGAMWDRARQVPNPWGDEADAPLVELWDCRRPPLFSQTSPVPLSVYLIDPRLNDPLARPSPAGTTSATLSGFDHCQRHTQDDGNLHLAHVVAGAPYVLESDWNGNQVRVRDGSDFTLVYEEPIRAFMAGDDGTEITVDEPAHLGMWGVVDAGGFWRSESVRAVSRNPFITRSRELAVEPVRNTTFYAYVSPAVVSLHNLLLPRGTYLAAYGVEACGSSMGQSVVVRGWACDPAAWWPRGTEPRAWALGGRPGVPEDGVPIGSRPGSPYQLRDIDCLDQSMVGLREIGLHHGIWTGTRCVLPP